MGSRLTSSVEIYLYQHLTRLSLFCCYRICLTIKINQSSKTNDPTINQSDVSLFVCLPVSVTSSLTLVFSLTSLLSFIRFQDWRWYCCVIFFIQLFMCTGTFLPTLIFIFHAPSVIIYATGHPNTLGWGRFETPQKLTWYVYRGYFNDAQTAAAEAFKGFHARSRWSYGPCYRLRRCTFFSDSLSIALPSSSP